MAPNKNAVEAIVQHPIDGGVMHAFGNFGQNVEPIRDTMHDPADPRFPR